MITACSVAAQLSSANRNCRETLFASTYLLELALSSTCAGWTMLDLHSHLAVTMLNLCYDSAHTGDRRTRTRRGGVTV